MSGHGGECHFDARDQLVLRHAIGCRALAADDEAHTVLDHDLNHVGRGVVATGKQGLVELVMASHAGNTPEEFQAIVTEWLATAKHPRFKRPYTEIVYQPMLELLGEPNELREDGSLGYYLTADEGYTVVFTRNAQQSIACRYLEANG